MRKITLNKGWYRSVGEIREAWMGNHTPQTVVNLPDDYIITSERNPQAAGGASTGFFDGGKAVYIKRFDVPEEWQGNTVLLDIDGAYMNAEATLNGEKLGIHPYGYTPWMLDLNPAIIPGEENELEIVTRCIQPDSRWYTGGGLYREVHLWTGCNCHIRPWDFFLTTISAGETKANINAEVTVSNQSEKEVRGTLRVTLGDVTEEKKICVNAKAKTTVKMELLIAEPKLWSAESPYLYQAEAEVETGLGTDRAVVQFGIRDIRIDAEQGMRVNGKPVKLLGGCIHHDNTLLGAAAFPRAEERKIELLKECGYNAVRCAHNPPSARLLEACDRIGMYVINESFDCWRIGKNDMDYHLYFNEWWERDLEAMILRDRNHPSVFCWSIGNEIVETGGTSGGIELTQRQIECIRKLDSSRPVTAALNSTATTKREKGKPARKPMELPNQNTGESKEERRQKAIAAMANPNAFKMAIQKIETNNMGDGYIKGEDVWSEITRDCADQLDIVGYNYYYKRYESDRKKFPKRVICGTETHASNTWDYYQAMMKNPNVIGDFVWTAYDNLGEAGAGRVMHGFQDLMTGMLGTWPWMSCYQGDLDLDGNRRPQSYYRRIMWGMDSGIHLFAQHPAYADYVSGGLGWQWNDVSKSWTWPEEFIGKEINVEAYADCDEIEFILNGISFGKIETQKLKATAKLIYEPGELRAAAWKDGQMIAEDILLTAGKPSQIELIADRQEIYGDGIDLSFVKVCVTDDNGVTVPSDDIELCAEVIGGVLKGFGSGNPCTDENYGTGKRRTWQGKALVCVCAEESSDLITLRVSAKGIMAQEIQIKCVSPEK